MSRLLLYRHRWGGLVLVALLLAGACRNDPATPAFPGTDGDRPGPPEKTRITIGTGGQELFIYLPLTLTKQLGYFEEAGLDVEILNFPGGGKALEALVGGGVDLVAGFYDHTIQAQPRGIALVMVAVYDRYPGIVMLAEPTTAAQIRGFSDLRGRSVGITSFGSSTHFVLNYLLARAGVPPDAVGIVQIGTGPASIAALEGGKVPIGLFLDPAATLLVNTGRAKVLWDTRSERDTVEAFGGPYLAGGLYGAREFVARHPGTVQAAVSATVRALHWIQAHSAVEIAERMPPEFYAGDKPLYVDSLAASLPLFSPDGRIPESGPGSVLTVLQLSDPDVQAAPTLDLAATYTNRFVEAAHQAGVR
jgi:NitT/TauT family transport system substrate-binding protein